MQISKMMFSTPAVLSAVIKEQQNKSLTIGVLGKNLHITEVNNVGLMTVNSFLTSHKTPLVTGKPCSAFSGFLDTS